MDTGAWGTSYAIPNVAFTVAKLTNTADANFYSGRTPNYNYMGRLRGMGKRNAFLFFGA